MSSKWVVRTKGKVPQYKMVLDESVSTNWYNVDMATHFDTKEEAQEWCNLHEEVIEVN